VRVCVTMSEFEGRQRGRYHFGGTLHRNNLPKVNDTLLTIHFFTMYRRRPTAIRQVCIRSRERLRAAPTPCDCSQGLVSEVVVPLLRYPTSTRSKRTRRCLQCVPVCAQYAAIGSPLYLNNFVRRCPTMLALLAHTLRNTDLRKPVMRRDSGNRAPLPHNASTSSPCTP